jgi:hypothetical protein
LSTSLLHLLVAACVFLAACGDDDDNSGVDRNPASTASSTTTETQPAASGEGQPQAFDLVKSVVLEATALTDELLQNPAVVNDPDNEDIPRLRDLYTDDSEGPDAVIDRLHHLAQDGQEVRAGGSGVFRQMKVFQASAVDGNTVRFRVCAVQDQETVDAQERVISRFAEVTQGTGEARRVDGVWRLYGIHRDADTSFEIEPGSADPNTCDDLYPIEDPA